MFRRLAVLLLGLAGLAFTTSAAGAAVSTIINYQGLLRDSGGAPVTGPTDLAFALYADSSGGTPLWSEAHPATPVSAGIFSVRLGSVAPFPSTLFSGVPLWLETSVASSPLTPRSLLGSSAYAFRAAAADCDSCIDAVVPLTGRQINSPADYHSVGNCLWVAPTGNPGGSANLLSGPDDSAGVMGCDPTGLGPTSLDIDVGDAVVLTGLAFELPSQPAMDFTVLGGRGGDGCYGFTDHIFSGTLPQASSLTHWESFDLVTLNAAPHACYRIEFANPTGTSGWRLFRVVLRTGDRTLVFKNGLLTGVRGPAHTP